MARYYFLLNFFPSLYLEVRPDLTLEECKRTIFLNLSEKDKKLVRDFLLYIDLMNIKALWMDLPFYIKGNFSGKELEEALLVWGILPDYVYDFLERYPENQQRIHYFSELLYLFYSNQREGFLKDYFLFEKQLRLILTALRAKDYNRNIAQELQFEDPNEPFIAYILAQKDMASFEPPKEFEWVKALYNQHKENPRELHKAFLQARFDYLDEYEQKEIFTIDQLLVYLAKLYLVERWHILNDQGNKIMEKIG